MTTLVRDRLPRLRKILYAVSDYSFSFTDTTMSVLFAIFMTDVAGLSLSNAALVILIGHVWDAVTDPVMGFLTDRTRTRWGRRRPYLLFGAIPFGFMFAMLWFRPPTQNPILLTAYFTAAYFFYDTCVTLITMPYFALTPEMTQDYDERTSLTMYRMAFSITGSLTAFIVPLLIIGKMHPENAPRVFIMGLIFGTICAIPPSADLLRFKRKARVLHTVPTGHPRVRTGGSAGTGLFFSPPEYSSSLGQPLTLSRFSCCTS